MTIIVILLINTQYLVRRELSKVPNTINMALPNFSANLVLDTPTTLCLEARTVANAILNIF